MSRFHTLTVADVRRETPDAVSIAFAVPDESRAAFAFASGQYLTLRTRLGEAEVRRSYSISSGLDDGELRIAVKRLDGGLFSSFANAELKVGDRVEAMPPEGRFGIAPQEGARAYLGFAAGSGITPILSLIRTVLAREPESRFTLFYGNRDSGSIIFKAELEDLKDRFVERLAVHHVLSREVQDVELLNGRLDADKAEAFARTVGDLAKVDAAYLCGPVEMTSAVAEKLVALGLPAERVRRELFTTGGEPAPRRPVPAAAVQAEGARLSVRLDGSTHVMTMRSDETVLDAALRQGLDLPYACRGGMCCTCRARIVEGAADMDQNFSLEPWEIAENYTLTCQARPTTATLAVDYDTA
jgi:ring-1,2-phenylacetyl-CoA epoxidase subunit PaaE